MRYSKTPVFTGMVLLLSLVLLQGCFHAKLNLFPDYSEPYYEVTLQGEGEQKILVIPVEGMITSTSRREFLASYPSMLEEIVAQLNRAAKDPSIKAVLLKVNSPGGGVTASDVLYEELMRFKRKTGVKIVSAIGDTGASGAYYLSMAADSVVLHPTTITGSIGVIFVTVNAEKLVRKIGVKVEPIKSGRHKDMGSPFKEMSEEERQLFQTMIDEMYERFITIVAKGRKLPLEQVRTLADGRIYTAKQAVDLKLADRIGYYSGAIDEAANLAGLPSNARVVIYRRAPVAEDSIYNSRTALAPDVDAAAKAQCASPIAPLESVVPQTGFYYLWDAALMNEPRRP